MMTLSERLKDLCDKALSEEWDDATLGFYARGELPYIEQAASIAERAADVEGMADLIARWIDNPGTTTPMRTTAEAISRYVLGGE